LLDASTTGRICLVLGAAGWGKTKMLEAWTAGRTAGRSVAWLAPGPQDGPPRLRRELQMVLAEHVPTVSPNPLPGDDEERVCLDLCRSLDSGLDDDLVLVIDDLQEHVRYESSAHFLECLCRHAPDRLHLVLASRQEPPFPLERLRGQGHVAEIDAPRLAFDLTEVTALVEATLGPSAPELASHLREVTGGWPAAVRFAVEGLRGVAPGERLSALARLGQPGGRAFTYLAEEVFSRESENAQELLRDLVVLRQADLALYRSLGFADPAALLSDLTRRGLVQFSPGPEDSWSPIRPVRDFIEQEPGHRADTRTELHRRAAQFFAARGAHGAALRHLVEAHDHPAAATLLREHGMGLVESGEVDTVLAAAKLPSAYLRDPGIQQILGRARQVRGEWASALECFQRVSGNTDKLPPVLAWNMGLVAQARAEFDEALAIFDRADVAGENTVDESLLLSCTAATHRMVGDYEGCRKLVTRALAAAERCDDSSARCAAYAVLAMLAAAEGDPYGNEAFSASALEAATASSDILQILRIRVNGAVHLLQHGKPRAAAEAANAALELGEACGYTVVRATALTIRGGAHATLGRLSEACEDFDAARDAFQSIGSRYLAWPLCWLGYVHCVRGDLACARAAYEEAFALAHPNHEVIGLSFALVGLARVRAADDLVTARKLAEQAVALGEGLVEVQALLTRGWVALRADDRQASQDDAEHAAAAARSRRDMAGLAEALVLTVLASPARADNAALLDEAIRLWREVGNPLGEAQGRLVAAHLAGAGGRVQAELAEQTLREHGVHPGAERAAGVLAMLPRTAPPIAIRSLGAFRVYRDGEPISTAAWQSKKARDLLKILVARRGRPVPREQLMELLWPDEDPVKATNRLSVLLSTVRSVLDPDREAAETSPVSTERGSVCLDLEQVEVDVEYFLAKAHDGLDRHEQEEQGDAIERLVAAEALYGGDFLEDDPYEAWAEPLREEARASYIAVLRALARRLGESGDIDRAVRYTLRLLAQDSYDEEAHLGLVRLLLDAGRRGEALRRYQIYTEHMRELGVEPSPRPQLNRTVKKASERTHG
jgi:DNA-binding SARP family transcriptional activator